jgi:dTDP-4-dehydrorhamnose reductase
MNARTGLGRLLVLGSGGMLGNALLRFLAGSDGMEVWGTARRMPAAFRGQPFEGRIVAGIDVEDIDSVIRVFATVRPQVIVNCVGLVKQLVEVDDPLRAIPINSLLPHRLARLAAAVGARFVHVSTDCVFSGAKGAYAESDMADAEDLYGRSKYLGEVDYPHAITLRTSIIGHELESAHGLIGWFLAQTGPVRGYRRAVFSGLPTVELARVIRDYVLPRPDLHGVYHVSAAPIAKYDLLRLVAAEYERSNEIAPDEAVVIDRSLDSTRFRHATGYAPPSWPELVRSMRAFG